MKELENNKMNALILGGNGFIGIPLARKLLAEGHKVRILDEVKSFGHKYIAECDYRCGDFANSKLLSESLDNIDVVFHLISTTIPITSNKDPIFDVQSNVVKTLSLLEQCIVKKIKKVVFTSSGGTIYGIPTKLPVHEDNQTNPQCSYGITKLVIEKYLSLFKLLHGLNYSIVRISNPYGMGQNPKKIQGVIPIFLNKIIGDELIEIWGDGEIVRDYIYIDDLVEGIYKSATINTISHVFNIGNGVGYSLNHIIKTISQITMHKAKINYTKERIFDIPEIYLDISRAKKELVWVPTTSLKNGIEKTWKAIQKNRKSLNAKPR